MKIAHRFSISAAAFLIGLGASPVLAQTVTATNDNSTPVAASPNSPSGGNVSSDTMNSASVDRMVDQDLNQQHRIQEGLESGQLTTAEAARLEKNEARVDQLESNALNNNGNVSAQDMARIRQAEYGTNGQITKLEDNGRVAGSTTANADMSADVQRDINQQQRIDQGLSDGKLTPTQVSALEGGQATVDTDEYKDGRNNKITSTEQQNIQGAENTQNTDIRNDMNSGTTVSSSNSQQGQNGQGRDHDNRGQRDRDHFAYYDRGNQNSWTNSQNGQSGQNGMTGNNDFRRDDHRFADNGAFGNDSDDRDRNHRDHDHYADNDHHDHDRDYNWSTNVSDNTSGSVTSNPVAGPMATSTNTNGAIEANSSANSPAVSTGASAGVTAGSTAPVTPVSTPAATPAPAPAPHVTPPHIPVAHK